MNDSAVVGVVSRSVHVVPPSVDTCGLYPVIGTPPLLLGACQLNNMLFPACAVTAAFCGTVETVPACNESPADCMPSPIILVAVAVYTYILPAATDVSLYVRFVVVAKRLPSRYIV